jgi:streptogramin lyase
VRAISGDGTIATVTPAPLPTGLVAAADGTHYIAETQGNAVLRIGADGRTAALGTVVQPTDVALASDRVYAVYLGSSPGSGGVASFAR